VFESFIFQVNHRELNPSGQILAIIGGDQSRPSSASKNKICDQEQNQCGCVENAKQQLNYDCDETVMRHRSTIETSTDTLVPESDVEERLRARSSTLVAHDATLKRDTDLVTSSKEPVIRNEKQQKHNLSEKPTSLSERRCKLDTRRSNCNNVTLARPLLDLAAGSSRSAWPLEVPSAAQERADAYFKNRFDTDGLPVHLSEEQRRLVAVYFTHQEQVRNHFNPGHSVPENI
jgi:hypothetical protein